MSFEPVRWGILSTANVSVRAVAPAIIASSNSTLVAVASRDLQRARDRYNFVPNVRYYGDYKGVLEDPQVEAVYIPLPNSLHARWAIEAMEAGKHVLCEKPLAVTRAEGEDMVSTASQYNRQLMEAFMYRFHPQTVWTLEQVRQGAIGKVRQVRVSFSYDIRSSKNNIRLSPVLAGGSLMDAGSFGINLCRAIYGVLPREVAARIYKTKPTGVDLAVNAILDYGHGCFGMIDASFGLPTRQEVEIHGDNGTLTVPVPFNPGTYNTTVFLTQNGRMHEQPFISIDQYRLEIEHFADCIRTNEQPLISVDESLDNAETIENIYEAAGHDWPIV